MVAKSLRKARVGLWSGAHELASSAFSERLLFSEYPIDLLSICYGYYWS